MVTIVHLFRFDTFSELSAVEPQFGAIIKKIELNLDTDLLFRYKISTSYVGSLFEVLFITHKLLKDFRFAYRK